MLMKNIHSMKFIDLLHPLLMQWKRKAVGIKTGTDLNGKLNFVLNLHGPQLN